MTSYVWKNGSPVAVEKAIEVVGEYDLIVAGGGVAGFGAALAAARKGVKTLLVERLTALGGLATMGLVPIPLDRSYGISREMLTRLEEVQGHWHRNTDPEKHKLILDRMTREAGVDLLLDTYIVDAVTEGDEIRAVIVESKSGRQAIKAKRFIDCTGDLDLGYMAGAEYFSGRPEDGKHQACSLDFRMGGVDWEKYLNNDLKRNDPSWIDLIQKAVDNGDLPYMYENHLNWVTHTPGRPENCGKDEVCFCISHSRNCDPLSNRDLTRMYLEGREQALIWSDFIRKFVPGCENAYLLDSASMLGVRESRRLQGEYVITTLDTAQHRKFDDAVTDSNHHFDLHNPDGPGNIKWAKVEINGEICYAAISKGGSWEPPCGWDQVTDGFGRRGAERKVERIPFDIPYRALVPVRLNNLLAAGRCLSSEFMAQAASRLIMTCCNTGQAAGTAMWLSLRDGVAPRNINVQELQQVLAADRGPVA